MKTQRFGNHKVTYYETISELPITRYHVYNKMLLVDSGIGSTIADFDNHCDRLVAYLHRNEMENAYKEIDNIRQNIYLIQSALSPKHLAFAAIIKEVDGVERNDITDAGLKETLAMIGDCPIGEADENIESAKKKIEEELELYFPTLFADSSVKEMYDLMLKRTKYVLYGIIEKADYKERIKDITEELITYTKPKDFSSEHSIELAADKQFERICVMLSESLHVNPKTYTVMEFYSAFDYLKEKTKATSKVSKKR